MQEATETLMQILLLSLGFCLIIAAIFRMEITAAIKKNAIRHRKLIRAVAIIVGVAIYLNVGWAVGTYYHNYIFKHTPQTFWQVVWKGGYQSINGGTVSFLLADQILLMFTWPLLVGVFVPITWVVYAIHHFIMLIFHAIVYVLWLVGAGGIAKLLGVG